MMIKSALLVLVAAVGLMSFSHHVDGTEDVPVTDANNQQQQRSPPPPRPSSPGSAAGGGGDDSDGTVTQNLGILRNSIEDLRYLLDATAGTQPQTSKLLTTLRTELDALLASKYTRNSVLVTKLLAFDESATSRVSALKRQLAASDDDVTADLVALNAVNGRLRRMTSSLNLLNGVGNLVDKIGGGVGGLLGGVKNLVGGILGGVGDLVGGILSGVGFFLG